MQGGVQLVVDKITYSNNMELYQEIIDLDKLKVNIDVMKLKAALNYYDDLVIRSLDNKYSDVSTLLFCIKEVIDKCKFTKKQRDRLDMWMRGYTEKEIADYYNISEVTVHNSLVVSCGKIAKKLKGEMKIWF